MDDRLILEKFFGECLRYWERTLNADSDLDKRPFINAIADIPHHNPYRVSGELIDVAIREEFVKEKYMDCYGRDWQRFYDKEVTR